MKVLIIIIEINERGIEFIMLHISELTHIEILNIESNIYLFKEIILEIDV